MVAVGRSANTQRDLGESRVFLRIACGRSGHCGHDALETVVAAVAALPWPDLDNVVVLLKVVVHNHQAQRCVRVALAVLLQGLTPGL